MRHRRLLLAATLIAAAASSATPALADDVVADDLSRATPIAASSGVVAWSSFDESSKLYRLTLQDRRSRIVAPIPGSSKPFDVSLGRDRLGRIVALYTRCRSAEHGCDVYRYSFTGGPEQRIKSVSAPGEDEAWPAQAGTLITFVRRRSSGGRGEVKDCDVPFVKNLSSSAPSKRLDRGSCGRTTGMSLRGTRIVQVTFGTPPSATRFSSQVRLLSARGGAVKVLAQQSSGEESNVFSSPNQSANSIWLTRTGVHPVPSFVRLDIASRRLTEIRARLGLSGALARDDSGRFWYVQTPESFGQTFEQGCTEAGSAPCRLISSRRSPFSDGERVLPPQMSITSSAERGRALFGDPFAVSGRLARTVVSRGVIVRTTPVPGTTVRLLRRVDDPSRPGFGETFVPTTLTTTTAVDGSWAIAIAAPPAQPWFSAVTEGTPQRTFSGRGTTGTVDARMTLAVVGSSFSGTVTPAQPGRVAKIQRLTRRTCQTAQNGQRFCQEDWATVADAPLNAAGTAFAATVANLTPGTYSAALPFADQQSNPEAYAGRTPDVQIGG